MYERTVPVRVAQAFYGGHLPADNPGGEAANRRPGAEREPVRIALSGSGSPWTANRRRANRDRQRLTELLYLFRRVSTHLSRLLDCRNTLRRAGAEDSLLAELEQAAEFIEAVTREVRRRI